MTGLSALLVGIGLGLRHATDADHVVVIAGLVQRERGIWRAARLAVLWGIGHTATLLGLGLLIVLAEFRVPSAFERIAELLVAAMLIGFGVWHLARHHFDDEPTAAPPSTAYARPLLIGLVHGLAGSAGIALLAATAIPSRALAVAYLSLFGLGTILGMVLLTVLISRPISWTMRRGGRLRRVLTVSAALLSIGLGVAILVESALMPGAS